MKKPLPPLPGFKPSKFDPTNPDALPRDPLGDAAGWSFKTLEHDENTFPNAIDAADADGRSCIYVPLDFAGRIGRWRPV